MQLVTPFDSAESCNAGASDGREYPDASALSIALGFSEAPGAQHANRQLKVTVGRFSNRSTTLDTWPIVLWELTVSDAGAGAEGCAPLWAALVTEEGAGPASEEWVLGEALEGGGCESRLRPTGWLYKLQRQYLGLWEDGPGREGGGVALAVEEVRSTGAISLAVGQPFTLCSVARRGGLFRSMRAECVPPGKRRGAARREGGLEARRAAVLAGCGEVCELGEAVPGAPLGFVAKRVDCAALWGNAALDEETDFWPPPPAVPELLAGDFSRGGALRTRQGEVRLDAAWGDEGERVWSASWVEQLVASFRASPAFFASSYGAEDKAALREGVRRAGVRGAGVLVVGSSFPWVESLLAEPPALFRAPVRIKPRVRAARVPRISPRVCGSSWLKALSTSRRSTTCRCARSTLASRRLCPPKRGTATSKDALGPLTASYRIRPSSTRASDAVRSMPSPHPRLRSPPGL